MNWKELDIVQECPSCKGTKFKPVVGFDGNPQMTLCPDCNVQGVVLTKSGKEFIEFLALQLELHRRM